MDQDWLLQGDDTVDAVQRRVPRKRQTGKATMLAAAGGIDMHPHEEDEQAPLLGAQQSGDGDENGRGDDGTGSDTTLADAWSPIYEDFEGLPWYRKPSVSC